MRFGLKFLVAVIAFTFVILALLVAMAINIALAIAITLLAVAFPGKRMYAYAAQRGFIGGELFWAFLIAGILSYIIVFIVINITGT